ncbi:hypothetical protein [Massilia sp. CF038]|uniref:hypothetical protein n=1 Tax=Massilia sp. CF038 TaxID=1881045 RepID=UPI00091A1466|nr:hypothetical protein [Massilia sp. CF038]SHG55917.1 Uncharacterized protein YtpQ, UPF0354 family [Massilia sp. CF038]
MGFFDFFKSTPSPERFTGIAAKGLRDAGFSAPIQVDQDEFRLLLGEDGKQIFNLNNFYRDYCRVDKAERGNVMQSYIQSMMGQELPKTFAEARAKLLPVLRSHSMIEYVALAVAGETDLNKLPASSPFSADAAIMIAYDTEHSMMTLTGSTLTDWNVSFETALAAAIDNLRDATISSFEQLAPGLFLGTWDDAYDTSRLLFPDVVYQLGIGGEPLAMVPTRSRFLVASSNDSDAQLTMIALAQQFVEEEGRQLSALMYRYENGRPQACTPTDPAVAERLAVFRRRSLAEDYAGQKDMLDKAHEKNGTDVFVASFQVLASNETGRQASFTVWTENVDTLLPEADLVALVSTAELEQGSSGPPKLVAWQDLQAATGAFEQLPGRYPARYKPANFPSPAMRDALPATEL